MKKNILIPALLIYSAFLFSQDAAMNDVHLKQLMDKRAAYNLSSDGDIEGYRIKIHFGVDRDDAKAVRAKFSTKFPEFDTYEEYQQPNFVILVGDYKTKLEAFEATKKIKIEFPNAFIVKDKIKVKM